MSRKPRDQPLCQARRGASVDQRAQLVEAEEEPDAGRDLEVGRVLLRAAEGAVPDPSVDLIPAPRLVGDARRENDELTESGGDIRFGPRREIELTGLTGNYGVHPVVWAEVSE